MRDATPRPVRPTAGRRIYARYDVHGEKLPPETAFPPASLEPAARPLAIIYRARGSGGGDLDAHNMFRLRVTRARRRRPRDARGDA